MTQHQNLTAFSSEQHVRDVALRISRMSEAIHHSLRQLSEKGSNDNSSGVYALLTEEYALRARANILLIEAKRFTRPDVPITQEEVLQTLHSVEQALTTVLSPDDLTELIVGLMLFANSIASRNTKIITILLEDLKQSIGAHASER